jgi:phage terminase large subunit
MKYNQLYLDMLSYYLRHKGLRDKNTIDSRYPEGKRSIVKFCNNGSARSGKTFSAIQFILTFLDNNRGKRRLFGFVLRNTLTDCIDMALKDFEECLSGISFRVDGDGNSVSVWDECEVVRGAKPQIRLWGHVIMFRGLDVDENRQKPANDFLFFNEAVEIPDRGMISGYLRRCRYFAIFDWNPSVTNHFVFDFEGTFNTFFSRTTYLDNKFLSQEIVSDLESKCPWDFKDFDFEAKRWLVPERLRSVNEYNKLNGTIDRWEWMVYGEGCPTARDGAVFPDVEWIPSFPDCEEVYYGLDFGYTCDPSALVRVGRIGMDVYIQGLCYEPCPSPENLYSIVEPFLDAEVKKREDDARGFDIAPVLVVCDSSDKYKDISFVEYLNESKYQRGRKYDFMKANKMGRVASISAMKKFRLHCVDTPSMRNEFQNYVYKRVHGITLNDPEDGNDHYIDASRYVVKTFWLQIIEQRAT